MVYEGTLGPWIGGKDLILYTIGRLGVQGARYKSLEFTGSAVTKLTMDDRFTMANMAVEAGAKNGIFAPDDHVRTYLEGRTDREGVYWMSDQDAQYDEVVEKFDVSLIASQVACPHSPDNVSPVSSVDPIPLNQVFIGSCTNGRTEDLRVAAGILKGRKAAKNTRLIVIPGSPAIYKAAMKEGILEILLDAGAVIGPPHLWPVSGRPYGHPGQRGNGPLHHQPEFYRPYGSQRERGLPGGSRGGGCFRDPGPDRRPGRTLMDNRKMVRRII